MKKKIAVIGSGISGIYAARELSEVADVTVFEKSRGFGGRMSTRTREDYQFDHGAQYFTVKSRSFQQFLNPFISNGVITQWNQNIVGIEKNNKPKIRNLTADNTLYISTPKMSSFCRHLSSDLNVSLETKVEKIIKKDGEWLLYSGDNFLGEFAWVIFAIPSHQVAEIIPDCFAFKDEIKNIKMQACYSLMLGFNNPLHINWDAANISGYNISWVAVNSSKPERSGKYSIIAHSTNEWAEDNIESDLDKSKAYLISELSDIMGVDLISADYIDLHLWLYANVSKQNGKKAYIDFDNSLAACGDWCIQGRVEAAFLSSNYLVNSIKERFK